MPRYIGVSLSPVASTPTTSYANSLGTGDRTATISVTDTTAMTEDMNNFVDGSTAQSSSGAVLTTGHGFNDGEVITFDLGSAKYIDEFKSISGSSYSTADCGLWDIQASTDASTWVTQSSSWDIVHSSSASTQSFTPTSANGFRYWRLYKNGTQSNAEITDAWWVEMEFKIADGVPGSAGVFTLQEFYDAKLG